MPLPEGNTLCCTLITCYKDITCVKSHVQIFYYQQLHMHLKQLPFTDCNTSKFFYLAFKIVMNAMLHTPLYIYYAVVNINNI